MSVGWEALFSAVLDGDNGSRRLAVGAIDEYQQRNVQEMLVSVLEFVNSCPTPAFGYLGLKVIHRALIMCEVCADISFREFWMQFLESALVIQEKWCESAAVINVIADISAELAAKAPFIDIIGFLFTCVKLNPCSGIVMISTVIQRVRLDIPAERIVAFLEMDTNDENILAAKVSILVIALSNKPNDSDLNAMFNSLLTVENPKLNSVTFEVLARQTSSIEKFIEPHLETLFILLEKSLSNEMAAIHALLFIVKFTNARTSSSILSCLLRLLSIPLSVFDSSEDSVYQFARLCVANVCERSSGNAVFTAFRETNLDIIPTLSIICELREPVITVIAFSGRYVRLMELVCESLSQPNFSIRRLCLEATEHLCSSFGPLLITDCSDSLLSVFEGFVECLNDELAQQFIQTLAAFFKKVPTSVISPRVLRLVELALAMSTCHSLRRKVSVCLNNALCNFGSSLTSMTTNITTCALSWLASSDDDSVISALVLAQALTTNLPVIEKHCFLPVWNASFIMRQRAQTGEDIDICDQCAHSLTGFLSDLIWDDMKTIIPSVIDGASQDLSVSVFDVGAGIESIAGFRQVSSIDPGKVVFVSESCTYSVISSLRMILSCVTHFQANYLNIFGDATLSLCASWIGNPVLELSTKMLCWSILEAMSKYLQVSCACELFLVGVKLCGFDSYVDYTEKVLFNILNNNRFEISQEHARDIAAVLIEKVLESSDEDSLEYDPFELDITLMTELIASSEACFLTNDLLSRIVITLENPSTAGFGLACLSRVFAVSRDCELFSRFAEVALALLHDVDDHFYVSLHAIESLEYVIRHCQRDQSFVSIVTTELIRIITHKNDYENDTLIFFDLALVTFVRLGPPPDAIPMIINALPMSVANDSTRFVISFIVDTLCSLPREAIRNDLVLAFLRSHLKSAFTTQEALSKIEALLRGLT